MAAAREREATLLGRRRLDDPRRHCDRGAAREHRHRISRATLGASVPGSSSSRCPRRSRTRSRCRCARAPARRGCTSRRTRAGRSPISSGICEPLARPARRRRSSASGSPSRPPRPRRRQRADVARTAILHAISHDLRSPLTAITTAAVGAAGRGVTDAERVELIDVIEAEGARLARLVDDLLDLSKIEAGAVAPQPDWCDLHDTISSAVAQLRTEHPIEFAPPGRPSARPRRRGPARARVLEPDRERDQVLARRMSRCGSPPASDRVASPCG